MQTIDRLLRIIRVKLWVRTKRANEQKTTSEVSSLQRYRNSDVNCTSTDTAMPFVGVLSFLIGAMIAVFIALQITWPIMDAVITQTSTPTSTLNTTQTTAIIEPIISTLPIMLVLIPIMIILRMFTP